MKSLTFNGKNCILNQGIHNTLFNIAVLTSGLSRGSNLRAMIEYFKINKLPVNISFVVRTKVDAPITLVCDEYDITCHHFEYRKREQFEDKVIYLCQYHGIHIIALAGFLKKLSPMFLREIGIPVLNIHPALLPSFGGEGMYGMNVHRAVFESGDNESGATVHLVDFIYDHGGVIAQQKTNISLCSSAEDVAKVVLDIEHKIYGKTIWEYLVKLYS